MHVLVVEDDGDYATALAQLFSAAGFETESVADGASALTHVDRVETHLVILDLILPDQDGLDVCSALRSRGFEGGIVIMSGRGEELDLVSGLDAGADDYLVKPCSIAELQSRVRSVLRRIHRTYVPTAEGPLRGSRLEVVDHHIAFGGTEIATRGREFDVLALLIEARGRVVLRETLMDEVWGPDWNGSQMVLPSAVGRIRSRLEAAGATEQVENVRGVGFRLSPA
ncbi:DNA-binding response OmpR family regulator [Nocardioides cavernae]|uniref:DNA-binding response OmpR family regulator n=1 Tax=Nocardioides cavernae TaxID=1921566 RepID=A0A7Y9H2G0_9ACTN|nr:response regulator transcription factor [Nocardioides cavernae]NYE36742.1 DNA-binding response OmpR family regulator [Nocardioides cavernae]